MKLTLNDTRDDETDPKRPRGREFHARITHRRRICANLQGGNMKLTLNDHEDANFMRE